MLEQLMFSLGWKLQSAQGLRRVKREKSHRERMRETDNSGNQNKDKRSCRMARITVGLYICQ